MNQAREENRSESETERELPEGVDEASAAAEDEKELEQEPAEASDASSGSDEAPSSDSEEETVDEAPRELSLEEQLEQAKAESQENYNSYLRAVADLDTYRRRVNREKDELRQYAKSGLIESFLPVYDNMLLGLQSADQTADPKVLAQGIQMVLSQFKSVLEENGVEEIVPEVGAEFDPNLHEAFQTQPSDEVEDGKVLACLRRGFKLNDRLVRPANVVVSGGPDSGAEESAE